MSPLTQANIERKAKMQQLRESGWTDTAIGIEFGLSASRVNTILGPRSEQRPEVKKAQREAAQQKRKNNRTEKEQLLEEARRRIFLLHEDRQQVARDLGLNEYEMKHNLGSRFSYLEANGLRYCSKCKTVKPIACFDSILRICTPCRLALAKQAQVRKKSAREPVK